MVRTEPFTLTEEKVGRVVSIVILRLPEAEETFPTVSVCLALIDACVQAERVDAVMLTVLPAQVPVPIEATLS